MKTFIGLDIGGTTCAVLLARVNQGIEILREHRFDTLAQRGFEPIWAQLCQGIDDILAAADTAPTAIGISCGGPLNSSRGLIMSPPNLPGWDNIPIVQMLEDKYGLPTFLQNDANACALVEWKLGAARGSQDMVFLTMGTGMGAGIILNNRLVVGQDNMAGEVGHLRLDQDGPVGFGKAGSFEGFTSGGGIHQQAVSLTRRLVKEGRPPAWIADGYQEEQLDAKLMAEYAKRGDKDALFLYDQVGTMLGRGLALIVDALNPQCIVIGSIFARAEPLLRPSMERALREEALSHSLQNLSILPAQTGERLGDYASIMTALYGLDIDPMAGEAEDNPAVLSHFERLFERWPCLENQREPIMDAYLCLREAALKGRKILTAGNGGSCADAAHIVGELMKGFVLKRPLDQKLRDAVNTATHDLLPGTADLLQQGIMAICLNEHAALSSAIANDLSPLLPFAQQVVGYGSPGDVLLVLSTSGNARNLALAVQTAKALGLVTIALTGRDGGLLGQLCDHIILAPGQTTADIQEHHLPIYHCLCAMLEAKFFVE